MKLSHSASTKYQDCGKAYELHYLKKWRATTMSAALLMGTAIDKATENYAINRDKKKARELFHSTWTTQEINGKATDLYNSTAIVYGNNDFDAELLNESDLSALNEAYGSSHVLATIDDIYARKDRVGYAYLSEEDKKQLNQANWLCLKNKGQFMLTTFFKVFDDNVEEVLGTQVKVELENTEKDIVLGFADLVVKWKGEEKPVVLDIKTSAKQYEMNSVQTSPQLSLYVYALRHKYADTHKAGFLVLNKNMNKNREKVCKKCGNDGSGGRHKTCAAINADGERCNGEWNETVKPTAPYQVIIDSVSDTLTKRVVENFNEITKAVKAEIFPRNFNNCIKYNGAVVCPYYDHCHKDKMTGIEVKEE